MSRWQGFRRTARSEFAQGTIVSSMGDLLFAAYRLRVLRPAVRAALNRFEGGFMFSGTLRRIFVRFYSVSIGKFTYGPALKPGVLGPGTNFGNFCSVAGGLVVLRRNHPAGRLSQHPVFYNHSLGLVETETIAAIADNPLMVGHDVWIGSDVIICPGCRIIGDGAIIGAGAVVTKDVPPYTIVAGNPAKPIRKRFSPEVEAVVAASEWWLRPLPDLVEHLDLFTQEITPRSLARFAAAFPPRSTPRSS